MELPNGKPLPVILCGNKVGICEDCLLDHCKLVLLQYETLVVVMVIVDVMVIAFCSAT